MLAGKEVGDSTGVLVEVEAIAGRVSLLTIVKSNRTLEASPGHPTLMQMELGSSLTFQAYSANVLRAGQVGSGTQTRVAVCG